MADTLLILELPSFRSLWPFLMSVLSFSPNCSSHSCASYDLVGPFTPRRLMNAPKASWMMCDIHGMWFSKAGNSIAEASSVDCSSQVIKRFDEVLSFVIPSKWPSVCSKRSRSSLKCMASLALVCWTLTYCPQLAWVIGKEVVINLIKRKLHFTQCPILIHLVSNDQRYGQFIRWCQPV
jgi:hypothetical protein